MKQGDLAVLNQLIKTMEVSLEHLDMAYSSKDSEKVIQIKKELINLQNKIIEITKK